MKLPASLRLTLGVAALLLVSSVAPTPCSALDLLKDVSKEEAKKLGITVQAKPRPQDGDVWVQIEFKPTGPKKEFKYTHLNVTQGGKKLVSATLMPYHPKSDTTSFDFYIDPDALPNATVTITVWEDPLTGVGYVLKMKDYLPASASR